MHLKVHTEAHNSQLSLLRRSFVGAEADGPFEDISRNVKVGIDLDLSGGTRGDLPFLQPDGRLCADNGFRAESFARDDSPLYKPIRALRLWDLPGL